MMSDDVKPPRRGRPAAEDPGGTVSVWLSTRVQDRLIDQAKRREQSLSATIREILEAKPPRR
jgi:hypothetical protein